MEIVASRESRLTGRAWLLPSGSWYWIMKESKLPAGTFHERRTELLVASEAKRSPRTGSGMGRGSSSHDAVVVGGGIKQR